jgi:hypothetical protein
MLLFLLFPLPGKVLLLIVKEVLTKFNLRESLLVFEAEANLTVSTRTY